MTPEKDTAPPTPGTPSTAEDTAGAKPTEKVNHPAHYNCHPSGVECIAIIEHFTFNVGNCIKYLWRAGLKVNEPEFRSEAGDEDYLIDLKKAAWYVQREVERVEQGLHPTPRTRVEAEMPPVKSHRMITLDEFMKMPQAERDKVTAEITEGIPVPTLYEKPNKALSPLAAHCELPPETILPGHCPKCGKGPCAKDHMPAHLRP